jgi:hypothetical protein
LIVFKFILGGILKNKFIKFRLSLIFVCLGFYVSTANAELQRTPNKSQVSSLSESKVSGFSLTSVQKSWLELAPNFESFEQGIATILVSIADYVSYEISSLPSQNSNLALSLKQQNCVKWDQSLRLSLSCLDFLKTNYPFAFDHIALEFLTYYDLETTSYEVKIEAKDFSGLTDNFVLKRLNSSFDETLESINPVLLLNPNVSRALWTVPGDDANCFGTAYAAVTPRGQLRYRDYLWSNKSPVGFLKSEISEPLIFGDLIEFEIPGDGHATVYLGTDQAGDHIVLTKNGFMPSVIQVMKYDDVYKLYEPFNITKVNVWRPDPKSFLGYASPDLALDETDFLAMINSRKNSVEVSVDEALALQMAKGFSAWKDKVK